jgi:hypothetical protein
MTIIPGWLLGQGRFWSHRSRSRGYLAAARGTVASRLGVAGGYERSSHGTGRLAAVVEQRNWAVLAVQGSESVVEVGAQYGCRATAVKDLSQDILENLDPKL